MKIESTNINHYSFGLEQLLMKGNRVSSTAQQHGTDVAVTNDTSIQNHSDNSMSAETIKQELSDTVTGIQTLSQTGQNLDGIHSLDLERVLRLIS